MSYEPSDRTHAYVHVLIDEVRYPLKIESKGFLKKKSHVVEFTDTIELINNGISKYGNRYVGTFDVFVFDKPEPIRLFSKTSYDELVRVFRWRHEFDMKENEDYDFTTVYGKDISKYSLLQKKASHITSELRTLYPCTTNPNDPDYEKNKGAKLQPGPPSEFIGPDRRPFGDFKMRLIYDSILIDLFVLYWVTNVKHKEELKLLTLEKIRTYENYTKLPEFGLAELNEIMNEIK